MDDACDERVLLEGFLVRFNVLDGLREVILFCGVPLPVATVEGCLGVGF